MVVACSSIAAASRNAPAVTDVGSSRSGRVAASARKVRSSGLPLLRHRRSIVPVAAFAVAFSEFLGHFGQACARLRPELLGLAAFGLHQQAHIFLDHGRTGFA